MFWKVSSFSSGSAIEGILDKQQFTLEELLEEDELVQVFLGVTVDCTYLSSSHASGHHWAYICMQAYPIHTYIDSKRTVFNLPMPK